MENILQFGTSINGFGSGFIFDVLTGRYSVDFISLGSESVYLSAGVFFDRYLAGKHKRKFKVDGEKEKVLIEPNEFKDFNLNKSKYGINASLVHKNTGLGIGFTYMLTPFFQEGKGPDLNEMRISFTFDFAKYIK